MWVMFDRGFLSAVQDADDPSLFKVRARDRMSLKAMLDCLAEAGHETDGLEIVTGEGTDYRWRVILPRELFGVFLLQVSDEIDYENFKNKVTLTRGKRWHDVLMEVWVSMLKVDDGKPNAKNKWDLTGRKDTGRWIA